MDPDLIGGLAFSLMAAALGAWTWRDLHHERAAFDQHTDQAIALTRPEPGTQPASEFNCTTHVADRELAAALEDWGKDAS